MVQKKLLEVSNLKKHFPVRQGIFQKQTGTVHAVDGVSFHINKGETLGLVGESGSGKTTIGRTILRAVDPTEGNVFFESGENGIVNLAKMKKRELKPVRKNMQMIFQDPYSSLNPRMTVRDIIAEPLIVNKICSGREVDERVRNIADKCKLNIEHLRRYPHAFSAGQRQRISIARGLVIEPEFVVCDESVSSLDVSVQAEIINLLQDLQEELDLTYLFIAHDLSVVEHICDRIAVLYLGRIMELCDTESLFTKPLHPYTEALMSAIPQADPDEEMTPVFLEGEIPNPMNVPSGCPFHPRCHYCSDICKAVTPELKAVEEGRFAACHFSGTLRLKGVINC